MANGTMEQTPADAIEVLIATEANRRELRELLGVTINFDLPTDLSDLLDVLDEAEEAAPSGRDRH